VCTVFKAKGYCPFELPKAIEVLAALPWVWLREMFLDIEGSHVVYMTLRCTLKFPKSPINT
jgi:hypothetical protein